jgi:hypothetical protein
VSSLLEKDQLLGYGELMIHAHETVSMHYLDQPDWLRRRQYIIEHQDRMLGEAIMEALKRGWAVSCFDRAMWSDFARDWWERAPEWVKDTYSIYRKTGDGLYPVKGYHIVASFLITRSEP